MELRRQNQREKKGNDGERRRFLIPQIVEQAINDTPCYGTCERFMQACEASGFSVLSHIADAPVNVSARIDQCGDKPLDEEGVLEDKEVIQIVVNGGPGARGSGPDAHGSCCLNGLRRTF